MGPGHLGRVLAISQGWWFRYHHGAKTRTEYEQVYEPEPDRTGLDWTRPEAGTGPDRTRSQKPEAGSRRPEAGLDQKPDQTGSRTGLETVLLQQYCCNSTVATVLLQQYCCNSIVATILFPVRSGFRSGPASGPVRLPAAGFQLRASGFWSGPVRFQLLVWSSPVPSGRALVRIPVRIPFGFLPHGGIEIITPD